MSWDTYLTIDTGGSDEACICDIGNCTWNLGEMFYESMEINSFNDDLNGKPVTYVEPILTKGYDEMVKQPEKYKKMNPKNGWGDYEGALQFLKDNIEACRKHPKATFKIC